MILIIIIHVIIMTFINERELITTMLFSMKPSTRTITKFLF